MRSRAAWAIFLSGRGSNAQALWDLLPELDIALVVSSRKKSQGLLRAKRLGLPTLVLDQQVNWMKLTQELQLRGVGRIFLLGFMKLLPPEFCQQWAGRMWNLHPSCLPEFPGAKALERSYEAGGNLGVSIHQVTADMDAGPLSLQMKISDQARRDFPTLEVAQMKISQTEQRLVTEWARRQPFGGGASWI